MSESEITLDAGHAAALEPSPYGVQSKKLTMWLFIISDAVTFGAILFGYAYLRIGTPNWSTPFHFSPNIVNGLIMTFVLLSSSLTMLAADAAAKQGRKSSCLQWLGATVVLGIVFATLHLREWFHMFEEGWSLSKNPLGGSVQFGATFFSITGLHLDARDFRNHRADCDRHRLQHRVAGRRTRRNHRPVLALCGPGLDVRVSTAVSDERGPLNRVR